MADRGEMSGEGEPSTTSVREQFPPTKIKIELVQPKVEVHYDEDATYDYNETANETFPEDAYDSFPMHHLYQEPHSGLTSNTAKQQLAAVDGVDSKSEFVYLLKKGVPTMNYPQQSIQDRHVCPGCDKSFKNNECLKQHKKHCEKTDKEIVKHKCSICLYQTKWKNYLKEHMRRVHPEGTLDRHSCTGCGKSYKNNYSLKRHVKNCEKWTDTIVKCICFHCSRETKWKESLRRHIRLMHPIDVKVRPTCAPCGKSFNNEDGLRKHVKHCEKSNKEIVKFKCSICLYETKWKRYQKEHMRRVHHVGEIGRQNCFLCGKTYKNIDSLKQHIKNCKANNVTIKEEE